MWYEYTFRFVIFRWNISKFWTIKNSWIITKVVGNRLCNVLVLGLLLEVVSEASSFFFFFLDTSEASSKLVLSGSNTSCAQSSCQQYK